MLPLPPTLVCVVSDYITDLIEYLGSTLLSTSSLFRLNHARSFNLHVLRTELF